MQGTPSKMMNKFLVKLANPGEFVTKSFVNVEGKKRGNNGVTHKNKVDEEENKYNTSFVFKYSNDYKNKNAT